ncbi:MAG: GNAT family N-acetyltransferase [Actinomycetota bacterium]
MTKYHRVTKDDLPEIATFAAALNTRSEHRIGYLGDKASQISHELLEYDALLRAFAARDEGRIVGFMAIDVDAELERSYFYGPLVDHPEWSAVAGRLVEQCLALVPHQATKQLEMFFDLTNVNAGALGRSLGFESYKDVRIMRFGRDELGRLGRGGAIPVAPEHHDSVIKLHDRLFPDTHTPGARLLEGLAEHRACFVRADGDEVEGYIYLEVEGATGSATLEFIGTTEGARGRGIGADLVRTGLHWMFGFESVAETWLTVDEDNAGAQRLYRSLGWTEAGRLTSMRRRGRPRSKPLDAINA